MYIRALLIKGVLCFSLSTDARQVTFCPVSSRRQSRFTWNGPSKHSDSSTFILRAALSATASPTFLLLSSESNLGLASLVLDLEQSLRRAHRLARPGLRP